jgi:hypothetical protein
LSAPAEPSSTVERAHGGARIVDELRERAEPPRVEGGETDDVPQLTEGATRTDERQAEEPGSPGQTMRTASPRTQT